MEQGDGIERDRGWGWVLFQTKWSRRAALRKSLLARGLENEKGAATWNLEEEHSRERQQQGPRPQGKDKIAVF